MNPSTDAEVSMSCRHAPRSGFGRLAVLAAVALSRRAAVAGDGVMRHLCNRPAVSISALVAQPP